jgi:branched-chain amino acid transport system ATP-binding protein
MSDAILSLKGVSKSFGGLRVIDDISFDIARGERAALIGPNGAGKTTIFNLISGVYGVDTGAIELEGKDIAAIAARHRIHDGVSRSFQNIRLMPHLSTVENVLVGQHHLATSFKDQFTPIGLGASRNHVAAARQALIEAGLETYPGQVVADLPYGVQKRIEVVRALMSKPKLLLLDEPAAGLNTAESSDLQALLEKVSATGVTLLVVEHDMHFVRNLCRHVVVLNFGRKIFEGTPDQVAEDEGVLEAYLGGEDEDDSHAA